jgi:3-oxoacyl-[acyl-carrier protein] reductase
MAAAADVTDDASIPRALDAAERAFGPIHGLVNCAGVTGKTNLKGHEVDMADFDAVYRINLRGAMALSKAVLPRMLARNYGRVLHVASIAGKEGNAAMAAYAATKAGVIGLVKSLGKDYAETGITINALAPAVIERPWSMPSGSRSQYMTDKIDEALRRTRGQRSCRLDRFAGLQLHDRLYVRLVGRTRDLLSGRDLGRGPARDGRRAARALRP